MGSGLRLLPLVAGLIVGAIPAARVVQLVGAKVAVAVGFVLLAVGLFLGSTMSVGSSGLFVAVWMAVAGLGTGIAMATAMSAALVDLSADKSGVGTAVLQAVNKTGGPFGIAVLGSVLSVGYLARLHLSGLPTAAASHVRSFRRMIRPGLAGEGPECAVVGTYFDSESSTVSAGQAKISSVPTAPSAIGGLE